VGLKVDDFWRALLRGLSGDPEEKGHTTWILWVLLIASLGVPLIIVLLSFLGES